MNFLFKEQSLKEVLKLNKILLWSVLSTSTACLFLTLKLLTLNERIVLIPWHDMSEKIPLIDSGYSEQYLDNWAYSITQTLLTGSVDTIDRQIKKIEDVSAQNNESLNKFFNDYRSFVKGSRVQSVFFPKDVKFEKNSVLVSGLFRYWFGNSDKTITKSVQYRLRYKSGRGNVILLTAIEEI